MRKGVVIFLVVLIVAMVGGVFYRNYMLDREIGEKEGLKMGYLYGFNDGKDGNPPNTDNLRTMLLIEGDSTYDRALLEGAKKGYLRGYEAGKAAK